MTKPLGLRPVHFPGKTDCHPKPPLINWWERVSEPNKTAAKREVEREIKQEIEEDN